MLRQEAEVYRSQGEISILDLMAFPDM